MPKYNVRFSEDAGEKVLQVEAPTPEAAAAARPPGSKLTHVSEAKRGRPPKQSLVPPDPA